MFHKVFVLELKKCEFFSFSFFQETNIEFESMDYDTSKYLGGDVKHTHMVKGLDFILLNRVRESLDKQKDEDMEA